MAPCFFRSEYKNGREQTAEGVKNLVHRELSRAPARRVGGIAVHSVFGDVDVKAAEIDCAKMIDAVINLVELEGSIRTPAFRDDMIEPIENPAIDEGRAT